MTTRKLNTVKATREEIRATMVALRDKKILPDEASAMAALGRAEVGYMAETREYYKSRNVRPPRDSFIDGPANGAADELEASDDGANAEA